MGASCMIAYGVEFSHTPSGEVYRKGDMVLLVGQVGPLLHPGRVVFKECDGIGSFSGLPADDAVWWFLIGKASKRGLVGVAGGVMVESPRLLESAIFGGGEDL